MFLFSCLNFLLFSNDLPNSPGHRGDNGVPTKSPSFWQQQEAEIQKDRANEFAEANLREAKAKADKAELDAYKEQEQARNKK